MYYMGTEFCVCMHEFLDSSLETDIKEKYEYTPVINRKEKFMFRHSDY
jgi:hypothetical protein